MCQCNPLPGFSRGGGVSFYREDLILVIWTEQLLEDQGTDTDLTHFNTFQHAFWQSTVFSSALFFLFGCGMMRRSLLQVWLICFNDSHLIARLASQFSVGVIVKYVFAFGCIPNYHNYPNQHHRLPCRKYQSVVICTFVCMVYAFVCDASNWSNWLNNDQHCLHRHMKITTVLALYLQVGWAPIIFVANPCDSNKCCFKCFLLQQDCLTKGFN